MMSPFNEVYIAQVYICLLCVYIYHCSYGTYDAYKSFSSVYDFILQWL